jgi:hypothetical protein
VYGLSDESDTWDLTGKGSTGKESSEEGDVEETSMEKLFMDRRASDNKYLHKDFHLSIDLSIDYVGRHFGDHGVRLYLARYATAYYVPLVGSIRKDGLKPLMEYFRDLYAEEGASDAIGFDMEENRLLVHVAYCPGVKFMTEKGHVPSAWHVETIRTVYGTLARDAGLDFEYENYDEKTGAVRLTFRTKKEHVS